MVAVAQEVSGRRHTMRASTLAIALVVVIGMGGMAASARSYEPVMDPASFVAGINHPYLPYVPGTTWLYEAETEDKTS